MHIAPSPIVELNRAVATSMAFGPAAGLAVIDPLLADPALSDYPFLPSVRADLLAKLGRFTEAKAEAERAAALTKNARERALFLGRAAKYGHGTS
jgi:predicted RNA polymerase sigma factor